jgi:hypothetical protein
MGKVMPHGSIARSVALWRHQVKHTCHKLFRGPGPGPMSGPVYRRVMASNPSGHIEQLPSGSWCAKVDAGPTR